MLGPTAEDVERKDDTSSTAAGLAYLRAEGARIMPALLEHEVTAVYVGLRAATEHVDYQVSIHADEGYACAAGFARPGSPPRWRLPSTCASSSARRACASSLARPCRQAEHAEHRRGVPPPVCGRRGDREGPRVRADRLLLRTGHARGAARRARLAGGARRSRRAAPPHARRYGSLPGFFCGAELAALLAGRRGERPGRDRRGRAGPGSRPRSSCAGAASRTCWYSSGRARRASRGTRATRASGCVTCTEQCRSEAARAG